MPSRTALLDTNALIAISGDDLSAARERDWHLTTSPWCFFELLCHLDEEPNFAKAKGNLMKFRNVEIVDKPLDRIIAERQGSSEPRIWGSDLAETVLDKIAELHSLDALKRSIIEDAAGNKRTLESCVDTARQLLDREAMRFQ